MEQYHDPVLLKESVDALNIKPDGIYVDVTFGGGGHSKEILKRLTTGKLFAFDRDPDAEANKIDDERFMLIRQNFSFLRNYLKLYKAVPVDGIMADLGVSSHQFDVAERGFSIRFDAELDMRMDKLSPLTAGKILNTYEEAELKRVFKEYGELRNAGKIASLIVNKRAEEPVKTVEELKSLLRSCTVKPKENSFYAQVFQALRIEVNEELDSLKELLKQSEEILKTGGRLVVISYHSLEDRLVKNFMRTGKLEGELEKDFYGNPITPFITVTGKPIVPTEKEISRNNRARSAKLRIAEKR
jgi:16S rRNA (cytosine1402-N4)-methyltransferase